ncbi:11467_t:CDS:2, partial [Dentiscutata heterogama]
ISMVKLCGLLQFTTYFLWYSALEILLWEIAEEKELDTNQKMDLQAIEDRDKGKFCYLFSPDVSIIWQEIVYA